MLYIDLNKKEISFKKYSYLELLERKNILIKSSRSILTENKVYTVSKINSIETLKTVRDGNILHVKKFGNHLLVSMTFKN